MKLLQIGPATPDSGYGVWRYLSELANALKGEGGESAVLNPLAAGSDLKREVQVHRPKREYPFGAYNAHLQAMLTNTLAVESLTELLEKSGPFDGILVHDWSGGVVGTVAQRLFRVPLLAMFHGTEVGRRIGEMTREEIYVSEVERWLCQRADFVFAPSSFARDELVRRYGVPNERTAVLGGGVAASTFEADVDREEFRSLFARPDEALVLCPGRLSRAKGSDLVLGLAEKLRGRKIRFVLAGDGELRAGLSEEVRKRNLPISLPGHLGTCVLGALYQVADAVAIPSRYEAAGIAALEALVHGLPVVAAREGGLPEIASAHDSVAVVPADSMADAIAEAATPRESCSRPAEGRLRAAFTMAHSLQVLEQTLGVGKA